MNDKLIVAGYGLFLFLGAFFGWKAGSKISLIMGLVSGILVFAGLYLTGLNPKMGFLLLTVIGGGLSIVFLKRLMATGKMMPSGMLLTVSALFCIYCLMRFLKA